MCRLAGVDCSDGWCLCGGGDAVCRLAGVDCSDGVSAVVLWCCVCLVPAAAHRGGRCSAWLAHITRHHHNV